MRNPPIKDGDWVALNTRLERIEKEFKSYKKTVETTSNIEEQLIGKPITTSLNLSNDTKSVGSSLNINTSNIPFASPTNEVVINPTKTETYTDTQTNLIDQNYNPVTIPSNTVISQTVAGQLVPKDYSVELKAYNIIDVYKRLFISDWITLHNSNAETITLTNLNVVNDISWAGPIANGRDQANAFTPIVWIHFFAIYNSNSKELASICSLNETQPTLPTGFDYWVKMGCARVEMSNALCDISQFGHIHFWGVTAFTNTGPSVADTYQYYNLIGVIPKTAKVIFGRFGLTTNPSATRGMSVASDTYPRNAISSNLNYGAIDSDYECIGSVPFSIPILEPLTMAWRASTTASHYGVFIDGFIDGEYSLQPRVICEHEHIRQRESRTL